MLEFALKKLLTASLMPLPIGLILLISGLLLVWWFRKLAITCFIGSLTILILFGITPITYLLMKPLEFRYPPLVNPPSHVHTIVVLGAGDRGDDGLPANMRLSSASLARLVEAIRLYHHLPHATLILSGGAVFGSPKEATTLNNVALMLGIPKKAIRIEAGSNNTYTEALHIKKMLRSKPFILVTSALHMPRAMALFKKQGLHAIAAPTQYLTNSQRYQLKRFFPNSSNLVYSDLAIHEYLGLLWARLTGKV